MLHPQLPACEDCKKWAVDLETGEFKEYPKGSGKLYPRGKTKPPCWQCPKLSEKDRANNPNPEMAQELSERNQELWELFQMWKIDKSGMVEVDELTLELFSHCSRIEESVHRINQSKTMVQCMTLGVSKAATTRKR